LGRFHSHGMRQIWSPDVRPFELNGKPVYGSAAVEVPAPRRWLFVSGQCSFRDGEFVGEGDIAVQVRQALANLTSLLGAAGATTADVVKLTAWVTQPDYVAEYARIRAEFFTSTPPASTTVVSQLVDPRMLIEVEAIAALYS
jgi:2-iminobutanoate/2-iminopropanoate deaminase